MEHTSNIDSIYNDIEHLSVKDRDTLYSRIKRNFYQDKEIVAYTTDGKPLTEQQYIEYIKISIAEAERGELISHEDLIKEIATW